MKCQFCQYTAQKSAFGRHEEVCEMKPKDCPYCGKEFKIERYGDHVDMCGAQTKKCEICERYVVNFDFGTHLTNGQCEKNKHENEAQKQLEQ